MAKKEDTTELNDLGFSTEATLDDGRFDEAKKLALKNSEKDAEGVVFAEEDKDEIPAVDQKKSKNPERVNFDDKDVK